jgi:hypothetical protein
LTDVVKTDPQTPQTGGGQSRGGRPVITVEFLADGVTAWGRVYGRGEKVSVRKGEKSWNETLDRKKKSWLDLDNDGQMARWGRLYFRIVPNPPGKLKGPRATEE